MKKNSRDLSKEIRKFEDFFEKKPDAKEKAWGLIHDFYNDILTFMETKNIKKAGLAAKLNISRPAVSKMFNETPNISIKKMVELADAVGIDIKIQCEPIHSEEFELIGLFSKTFKKDIIEETQEVEELQLKEGTYNQIVRNKPIRKSYKI